MGESNQHCAPSLPEALARTLRHEVGDLLQTIYAAVAILQKRLPADATLERRVLVDLRNRAEGCKHLLDNVSDLVSPLSVSLEEVDLAHLAANLVAAAAGRYPNLEIQAASSLPVAVPADEKRIAQVGDILLTHACGSASRRVSYQTRFASADAEAEWSVVDDRPLDGNEQLEQLFSPLDMNRHATTGIGLALAKRLVLLHGGQIAAERSEGNFCVRVRLPRQALGKGPQELTN